MRTGTAPNFSNDTTLTQISSSRHSMTMNISKKVRDTDILTTEEGLTPALLPILYAYTRPTQGCHFE